MHSILGAAEALGEPLVGLVAVPPELLLAGSASTRLRRYSIAAPVGGWQPYFLVRLLTGYRDSTHGTFTFPDPFLGA